MEAKVAEGWPKGHEIRIVLSNTDAAQVNAIRRALIADVPKMAITRVDFNQGVNENPKGDIVESVNVLPDEVLAHRLAMLPIPTYLDEGFAFPDECENCINVVEESRGCPNCQVLYSLSAYGPSADTDEKHKTIYAGDITTISDPMFEIRDEHKQIPITILSKGQYLEFYAFAVLGRGREHSKWSPVAGVGFRPLKEATLKNEKKAKILFELDLKTTDGTSIDKKLFGTKKTVTNVDHVIDLEKAMHQVGPGTGREEAFDGAIELNEVENSYILSFETDGRMDPVTVFNRAMFELNTRFESLGQEIVDAF